MKNTTDLLLGIAIGAIAMYGIRYYKLLPVGKKKKCGCGAVEPKKSKKEIYCEKEVDAKMAKFSFASGEAAEKFRVKALKECMAGELITAEMSPVPLSEK